MGVFFGIAVLFSFHGLPYPCQWEYLALVVSVLFEANVLFSTGGGFPLGLAVCRGLGPGIGVYFPYIFYAFISSRSRFLYLLFFFSTPISNRSFAVCGQGRADTLRVIVGSRLEL